MLQNDLHVHTLASGHAFSTISEIFEYASKKKMGIIAITDHGPSMEHAPHLGFFEMLSRLPEKIDGVRFLKSCEANILNVAGEIDIPANLQNNLDFVMAGIHNRTGYSTVENNKLSNTQAITSAIKSNNIKVISHPVRPEFPVDINAIVEVCAQNDVAIEINLSVLKINKNNKAFIEEIKYLIVMAAEKNAKITVSSDAHYVLEIGDDSIFKQIHLIIPDSIWLKTKEQILDFFAKNTKK